MNVRTMLKDGGVPPSYATMGSAGADISSNADCVWTPIYSEPLDMFKSLEIPLDKPQGQNKTLDSVSARISDIKALMQEVRIIVGWKCIVSTGVYVELPKGYELQIRPRSGSAFKWNVTIINAPGTIDEDYRGEIGIALQVTGELASDMFVQDVATEENPNPARVLPKGMKIGQCVLASYDKAKYIVSEQLGATARGDKGIGSSGIKISDSNDETDTSASISVEFNVGDIHLIDITMGTMARLVKSLSEYNKDFQSVDDLYATNIDEDKMMFITYDVYEFDYNKQDLLDRIKNAVDLLGGREKLQEAYDNLPEKKQSY